MVAVRSFAAYVFAGRASMNPVLEYVVDGAASDFVLYIGRPDVGWLDEMALATSPSFPVSTSATAPVSGFSSAYPETKLFSI